MYRATTRSIEVTVVPRYEAGESAPADGRYFWSYTITIANRGREVVQLRTRVWKITDGNGKVEEVRGRGVVGKEPILRPGEQFEYTSGCPLGTTHGIMAGTYQMQNDRGDLFLVEVPAFSLDLPDAKPVLN